MICVPGVDGYQKLVDILNHPDVADLQKIIDALIVKAQPLGQPETELEKIFVFLSTQLYEAKHFCQNA